MSRVRYESLDVIRGYAALSVVIAHTTSAGIADNPEIWKWVEWSPLRFLFAGHQAVIMFFALSGFALTVMIQSMREYNYKKYLAARIVRLWPPYAASIIITAIVVAVLKSYGLQWQDGWAGIAPFSIENSDVIKNLLMLGTFNPFSVNPPVWSLIQEMRISIIFPLILMVVLKYGVKSLAALLALAALCCIQFYGTQYANLALAKDSYIFTLSFISPFAMGCFIAINVDKISSFVKSLSASKAWIIFIISYAVYSYSFNRPWSATERLLGDITTSIASFSILCLSLRLSDGAFVSVGKYLGKISYSLYLTHISVFTVLMTTVYKSHSPILVWVLMLPISIILADIFTRTVDVASIKFSRNIYKR